MLYLMNLNLLAPELDVSEWVGQPSPLADLRGQVVLIKTFQMLCPGCVSYGLPQAKRVQRTFPEVAVLGLHTVFEHHDAMGPTALKAFMHEYRITFPVGIDRNDGDLTPVTMRRYALQGTPSTLLIDRAGRLVASAFGEVDDLVLGAQLGQLLAEPDSAEPDPSEPPADAAAVAAASPGHVCQPGAGCS